MTLPGILRSLRGLEDLPRVAEALGYTPAWRELGGGRVVVGEQGEFLWQAVATTALSDAIALARRSAASGLSVAVLGLDQPGRRLVVAVAGAPPLIIALDAPAALHLARLSRCQAHRDAGGLGGQFRVAEALAGKGVDEQFYQAFRRTLSNLVTALPARLGAAERHALALLHLTRILFLYFVQAKGWLDARSRFLREEVDRCLDRRRSLHRDLLQPLFFGTLNRPADHRSRLAKGFGAVPFLNGGLFEPHPLERGMLVHFPSPVLREAFDGLFERFHFTLAPDSDTAIAPDMLGRVFERVMDPGERHATGSYYTPVAVVERLLADGVATWLADQLGLSWPAAKRRLEDPDRTARAALRRVRLLDPAVGSGAFLLGALRLLAGPARASGPTRSARLRSVLATQLFGVDRNAAAVRLAELRLWLEVVAADPNDSPGSVAPLPNLDALIRQGDSLSDPADGLPLPVPPHAEAAGLAELRRNVVTANGPDKRQAASALIRMERRIARSAFIAAIRVQDARIGELLQVARSPTLFGSRRGFSRDDRSTLLRLRASRRRAREQLRTIERTGEVPWFHYPIHFADVMEAGGFDLVVGNPPWIRAEALDRESRRRLGERFRWFRGARATPRGYAHQPDLAVAFLERALELLAPRGVLAMLVPAKLATTGYAATAREELARRTTIALAADLRNDNAAAFDATVYPMALVASLRVPPPNHRLRKGLGQPEGHLPQRSLGAAPWNLAANGVRNIAERLRQGYPPVRDFATCHLGVKTGLNRAFLDPPMDMETALVRWAIRGRDVEAFRVTRRHRLLWPCDEGGGPLEQLPPIAARHLGNYTTALRRRADHHGGPPWVLFRTGPAAARHRVAWADIARRLTAAALSGREWRDAIPLNSCYVAALPDAASAYCLAAWLNSTWCRALAAATADPASGRFFRFNARVVSALPLPAAARRDETLALLARRGMEGEQVQEELDARCADLLALDESDRAALAGVAGADAAPGR